MLPVTGRSNPKQKKPGFLCITDSNCSMWVNRREKPKIYTYVKSRDKRIFYSLFLELFEA